MANAQGIKEHRKQKPKKRKEKSLGLFLGWLFWLYFVVVGLVELVGSPHTVG